MTTLNIFQAAMKLREDYAHTGITTKAKPIEEIVQLVVDAYKQYGSTSTEFNSVYRKHFNILEQHKVDTLCENEGKDLVVCCIKLYFSII